MLLKNTEGLGNPLNPYPSLFLMLVYQSIKTLILHYMKQVSIVTDVKKNRETIGVEGNSLPLIKDSYTSSGNREKYHLLIEQTMAGAENSLKNRKF